MAKCCKYSAGMLREPVEFQRIVRNDDGGGGFTEDWSAISGAPTHAFVKPISGRERWASQRVEATASHMIVVRYYSDLTEVDRAVIRGRAYNIRFLRNVDFDDKWLEISAEVGVAV